MKTRRSGLGSPTKSHRRVTKSFAKVFSKNAGLTKKAIQSGSCEAALDRLIMTSRAAGSMQAHRQASHGRGLKLRRQRLTTEAVVRALNKLADQYRTRCSRGR